MKLGLLVRADNGGLGSQTWELYNHLKPAKTMVIDISDMNKDRGQLGYDNYLERFTEGEVEVSMSFPNSTQIDTFLTGLDIVMTVETPYSYYLFKAARERGVKSVLQFNYEFLDYFVHPEWEKPDLFLAPSTWNLDKLPDWGVPVKHIPVPINRKMFPFTQKTQAKKFLHIAGHATYADRNGTETIIKAIPHVQNRDVQFVIRTQHQLEIPYHDYRLQVETRDYPNYWELYGKEDVLLLPRKYGGLSLQLNEAMSTGMIPVMLNVSPQNTFLHKDMLIDSQLIDRVHLRNTIEVYDCTPEQLAAKIDWLAEQPEETIKALSDYSHEYAISISWENLTQEYIKALEECLNT